MLPFSSELNRGHCEYDSAAIVPMLNVVLFFLFPSEMYASR